MSENGFGAAIKAALAKKQAAQHPDAPGTKSGTAKKTPAPAAPSSKPSRRAASRGG